MKPLSALRLTLGLFLGPLVFLLLMLPQPEGLSPEGQRVGAVAAWMAIWWISEAIPIPATALLPIVVFPSLAIMPAASVTLSYANHLIYLFMGGFMIAVTMERWNLHRRIALQVIRRAGMAPTRLVLPVLGALSQAIHAPPMVLMVTATVCASYAFMLPVATPPNAIVFGSRCVTIPHMARTGLGLNLLGVLLITAFVYWRLPGAQF